MTIKELSKYRYLKLQEKRIEEKLVNLNASLLKATIFSDTKVITNKKSDPTEEAASLIIDLKKKLEQKKMQILEEQLKIENFIDSIADIEIQTIIDLRFLRCMTWEKIDEMLGYSRTATYHKLKKYLKKEMKG